MGHNFSIVKRGYEPAEVDAHINNLEKQLNEYKEKASAISNAIVNAQIAADNIIKDAQAKTEKMLISAEDNAVTLKQKTFSQLSGLKTNVGTQRKKWESFLIDYDNLIKKHLKALDSNDSEDIFKKLDEMENLIDNMANPEKGAVAKMASSLGEKKLEDPKSKATDQSIPFNTKPASAIPPESIPIDVKEKSSFINENKSYLDSAVNETKYPNPTVQELSQEISPETDKPYLDSIDDIKYMSPPKQDNIQNTSPTEINQINLNSSNDAGYPSNVKTFETSINSNNTTKETKNMNIDESKNYDVLMTDSRNPYKNSNSSSLGELTETHKNYLDN